MNPFPHKIRGGQEGREEATVCAETVLPGGGEQPHDAGHVWAPLVENQTPALPTQVATTPAHGSCSASLQSIRSAEHQNCRASDRRSPPICTCLSLFALFVFNLAHGRIAVPLDSPGSYVVRIWGLGRGFRSFGFRVCSLPPGPLKNLRKCYGPGMTVEGSGVSLCGIKCLVSWV